MPKWLSFTMAIAWIRNRTPQSIEFFRGESLFPTLQCNPEFKEELGILVSAISLGNVDCYGQVERRDGSRQNNILLPTEDLKFFELQGDARTLDARYFSTTSGDIYTNLQFLTHQVVRCWPAMPEIGDGAEIVPDRRGYISLFDAVCRMARSNPFEQSEHDAFDAAVEHLVQLLADGVVEAMGISRAGMPEHIPHDVWHQAKWGVDHTAPRTHRLEFIEPSDGVRLGRYGGSLTRHCADKDKSPDWTNIRVPDATIISEAATWSRSLQRASDEPAHIPDLLDLPDFRSQEQIDREDLIERVKSGGLFRDEAERMAAEKGLSPLKLMPDPAEFDVMSEFDWTVVETLAWIIWREAAAVLSMHRPYFERIISSPFDHIPSPDILGLQSYFEQMSSWGDDLEHALRPRLTFQEATEQLRNALRKGEVRATALDVQTRKISRIEEEHWALLNFRHSIEGDAVLVNPDGTPLFGSVKLPRHEIITYFPKNGLASPVLKSGSASQRPKTSASPARLAKVIKAADKFFERQKFPHWTKEEAYKEINKIVSASRSQCEDAYQKYYLAKNPHVDISKPGRKGPINPNRNKQLEQFRQEFSAGEMES